VRHSDSICVTSLSLASIGGSVMRVPSSPPAKIFPKRLLHGRMKLTKLTRIFICH
jgi:hypothetical protein